MGFLERFFGRKRSDVETIAKLKDRLDDLALDMRARERMVRSRIKAAYARNRRPPAAVLVLWKNARTLGHALEGASAALESALMMGEVSQALAETVGAKDFARTSEAVQKVLGQVQTMQATVRELVRMQQRMVMGIEKFNERAAAGLESVDEMVAEAAPEAVSQIATEFLEEISAEDPDFARSLPEDIRRQLGITNPSS